MTYRNIRKNFRKKILCTLIVMLFVSQSAFAQDNQTTTKAGPKKQLTMIFLAGLGGAVLGLSTLSFYGRPQDNLGNIAGGFAVGIIIGTIYVTYHTATKPKEYLSGLQNPDFIDATSRENMDFKPALTAFTYNFTF